MLDCFRTGGANSPETFVTAVAATLVRYPDEIIYAVTDPVSGLPSQLTWMPTIKDVYDACERAILPIRQHEARLKRIKEQFEMREREERNEKPTLEQLHAKYGKDWGLTPREPKRAEEFKAPSWQSIASSYSADPSRIKRLMKSDVMPIETQD
jgi:hypothetical protein